VSGVQIAGLRDIGLMKLDAVAGRGTRKDFYDLYFIADQQDEPILLQPVRWERVKEFFVVEARRLGQSWLDQT